MQNWESGNLIVEKHKSNQITTFNLAVLIKIIKECPFESKESKFEIRWAFFKFISIKHLFLYKRQR